MKIKTLIELFILQILGFSIWTYIESIMDLYKWSDKKRMHISSLFILFIIIVLIDKY